MALSDAALHWPPGEGEMARRIREQDWTATPLGPVRYWPQGLRAVVDLVLGSGFPMVALWGPELVQIYNDGFRLIMGEKHPAGLGQPAKACWPEAWHLNAPIYDRVWTGESVTYEDALYPITRHGALVNAWFTLSYSPLRDKAGAVAGVLVTVVEVTNRVLAQRKQRVTASALRKSEARQAFLLALGDALRAQSSTSGVIKTAARLLGEHLAASRIVFAEFDEAKGVADIFHGWFADGAEPSPAVMRLEDYEGPILDDLRAGRVVRIGDTRDPAPGRRDLPAIAEGQVRALLSVPLVLGGRLVMNLSVHQYAPRAWTSDEVALAQEVAERLWADLVRARTEAALRQSETCFRALLTAGSYMIYRMNPDWTRMFALQGNGILADTGEPFTAWVDKYLLPEDRPLVLGRIDEAIRTRSVFELEHRVWQADGSVGWVLSRAVPILGDSGEILEWFGAGSDVTARRRMEERLREAEESHRIELEQQIKERTAELKESRDLLQATMDSSTDMIQVFKAVRDETGAIVDFRWVLNNHTFESRSGRIEGESLLERNPGVVAEGIFDTFKRVTETGTPEHAEGHYRHEEYDGWFLHSVVKLGDGVATTTKEITDWKAAQAEVLRLRDEVAQAQLRESQNALQESESRFRTIVEAARDYAIFTTDPEGRIETWPPGAQAVFGWSPEEAIGQPMDITFTPEDRETGEPAKERQDARETGQAPNVRWHQRRDGTRVFIEGMARPLLDAAGTLTGFLKAGQDVTARRATQAALRESERRFRSLAEGIPQLVWRAAGHGYWTWASPQWTAFTGQPEQDSHGWGWLDPVHPDDRESARAAWERSKDTDSFASDYRLREAATGEYRWFQTRATPVRDEAGQVVEWLGTSTDVQDLRELQERQGVLVAELQHRTRNLMAVVNAVTQKTLRGSASLEDFEERILDRLGALNRVNGLLSRLHHGDRVSFDDLIRTELLGRGIVIGDGAHPQVRLEGPGGLRLRSSTVQTLALGLHELATNALKHGALSRAEGRLEVAWSVVPDEKGERRLRVEWQESGVRVGHPDPMPGDTSPPPPRHRGYGRELIEKALPYQLRAETTYLLGRDGLHCTITLPLSSTVDKRGLLS
ncbi:PAS domain S-box protein [Paracoccus benzoatiresistens]|uniref:histidine kinase n=1 Tax=Paracoccus benzoatiresistens TaxID=2997341 RepID=A0ABT4J1S4_9RHOB|nr:PAS domain S-box protein [Paracoccus sp. EF6]MCZ0961050.1 PAS domain S-box protein [Paracoccus sp. EF6]